MINCFKFNNDKDIDKVKKFCDENNIDYRLDHSLFCFLSEEAPHRIDQCLKQYDLTEEQIKEIVEEHSDGLIDVFEEYNESIIDNDYVSYLTEQYLEEDCNLDLDKEKEE